EPVGRSVRRDLHHQADVEISGRAALRIPHAAARETEPLAALAALRHLQADGAVGGRHLDARAANRLPDRDRNLDREVVAVATDERVRAHGHPEIEIARSTATPCAALAADPDARPVPAPGRDLAGEPLSRLDVSGSTATGAGAHALPPRSLALRARRRTADRDGQLGTAERVQEVDLDGMLEVLSAGRRCALGLPA